MSGRVPSRPGRGISWTCGAPLVSPRRGPSRRWRRRAGTAPVDAARPARRDDALSTHVGDGTGKGVDDPVGVGVGAVVPSGGTVGDTVGLGVGVGEAEGVAVDVGEGVTLGVGSGDAVPDGELPPLGGILVPDGALGGPELASSASRCLGKGCRPLAGGPVSVQAVVAGCFCTLSFEWMPMIATIATTAKEQPTTAISRASFSSLPIFPRCLQSARTSSPGR